MNEMLEWAHLRLSAILRVPSSAVTSQWELQGDQIVPVFVVDHDAAEGVEADSIQEVAQAVAGEMRFELNNRLEGLSQKSG